MSEPLPGRLEADYGDELDDDVPTRGYQMLPVVGLGGSAGGIAALRTFFEAMPPDSGLAFVVIMHLAPEHDSVLAEVLQRSTPMCVVQVQQPEHVRPNTVYVIPPGRFLKTVNGQLQLEDMPSARGRHVAVDMFFRTLAESHGHHASAVVLSGGDSDGAIGIKRIKERGGLTIAQDPDEAEHSDMPRSAMATGMVDWVLPMAQMPRRLIAYHQLEQQIRLPPEAGPQPARASLQAPAADEAALREVLAFLRSRTGRDFGYYKRATIVRRIGRRMQVNGSQDLTEYLNCLRTSAGEAAALLQDLLISVTNFFRDSACFDALAQRVPELFRDKAQTDSVRVWVAACATGEEAYSVAMLLNEYARTLDAPPLIQVFATDLDGQALQAAREGSYPLTIEADVSESRLRRYFVKDSHGYRVRRELRESVLFAAHDLLKDPPFSHLDLVSCRNLLIYLNHDAQARVFEIFHFALRANSYLFLGSSESVDDGSTLFGVADKKHRLYIQRPAHAPPSPLAMGSHGFGLSPDLRRHVAERPASARRTFEVYRSAARGDAGRVGEAATRSWGEVHYRLLEHLAPPSILVNHDHDILHMSASVGRFLQFSGGEPTVSLLRAVDPCLRIEFRALLAQAAQSGQTVEAAHVSFPLDGGAVMVTVRVSPASDVGDGLLLVTLEAEAPLATPGNELLPLRPQPDEVARHLDNELERLRLHLRETIEDFEASTEELKASNEELQAMNEELRSATEELETSREELQSINEELITVNQELKAKVDALGTANSDMHNLIDATAIAIIFLDRELQITLYTPSGVPLFNLIPTDVGRPLSHLSSQLIYPTMVDDARAVLERLIPIEREIEGNHGGWFLARMRPYRALDDRIGGVVLTFVDISERKQTEAALRISEERLRLLIENARDYAIFATDLEGRVTAWNNGAERLLGYSESEVLGNSAAIIFTDEDQADEVPQKEFHTARREGRASAEGLRQRKDGSRFWGSGSLMAMRDKEGATVGFVKVLRDTSEARQSRQALEHSRQDLVEALRENEDARRALVAANTAKDQFLAALSHELRTPLTPVAMGVHVLLKRDDLPANVRTTLALIQRNVRVEARLIDDLLDLTRISRGALDIVRERVDVHEALRMAAEISLGDVEGRQQALTFSLDALQHHVVGDSTRLQQTFWNLIKNASKFTPMNGHIEVATRVEGVSLIVSVTDDGVGIDPEALPMIFDAFQQGGDWVARQFGGLGLGLAIAKATVDAHGGHLIAGSKGRGLGATFAVELPLDLP